MYNKMNVIRSFGVGTIVILCLLAYLTPSANACSCAPSHPQTYYCDADYVIVMRVLRKSESLVKHHMAYKIEIKKSYKMSNKAQNYLKHGRFTTALSDSMCGVKLEVNKLYVVAGRGANLSICDFIKEYQDMSIVERRGFAGSYRKGCKCKINFCMGERCLSRNGQSCNWSPYKKCETNFSSCAPSVFRTPEGSITKCYWKRTPAYKNCIADP